MSNSEILVEDKEYTNEEETFYPAILSSDAEVAASSLTIEESKDAYEALKEIYEAIKNKSKSNYTILYSSVTYSKANYEWFATFFKELERLIMFKSFYKIPEISLYSSTKCFYPPFCAIKSPSKDSYIIRYYKVPEWCTNIVEKYRYTYSVMGFEANEFREGFPEWIKLKSTTVYNKYDERINTRVRIDYKNGEYQYFLSGASDRWRQVMDVPLEIDVVVSSLLYRKL